MSGARMASNASVSPRLALPTSCCSAVLSTSSPCIRAPKPKVFQPMPNGKVAPYPLDDLAELLLRFEEDRSEWGQRQGQAVQVAVAPDGPGVDPAQVALPAAAVHRRLAVQQLAPVARHRRADLIVMPP